LLPQLPPRRPDAPGQFAFADRERVRRILKDSGWREIDIRPLDLRCRFPERDLMLYLTRLGPVGRVLHEVDETTRGRIVGLVREAFAPYVRGNSVQFDAACWEIVASN